MGQDKVSSGPRAERLLVHIDGSSLGNPGPGGAGIFITDEEGRVICERSVPLGIVTNNQAEYRAFIEALRWLLEKKARGNIEVFTDSQLLYEQIAGRYRLKDPELARLVESARALMARLRVRLTLVEREKNTRADLLARKAARYLKRKDPEGC
ncbi:MAG: ribonuclease HI family protein [candidate division WOR-3 bacterium]